MGEIDTKPIESVQTAITFFGETPNEHRKNSPTNDKEVEREREMERLERELASVKVQLEVREAAHKQALLKADHYQKTADELSTLLKNSDLKKNLYITESQKAGSRVAELESGLEQMQGEVDILREAKVESTSQMQAMERLLHEEKLRNEELSSQVSETNEAITRLKMEIVRIDRSHAEALAAKEAEKSDSLKDLENQIMEKSGCIDSLRMSSERAVSELNELKEDVEQQEMKILEQAAYICVLEAKLEQIRSEAEDANEEATRLNEHVGSLKTELEKAREQENVAQVEIALLKFQLHKGRSKLASAEAAETRAHGEKTALYNALQQMGLEAEEIKRENRMLKEEALKLAEVQHEEEDNKVEEEEEKKKIFGQELEDMKRELEGALSKLGELRTRAEQAISRAEAAEKAKAALEEEKRKRREQRERRKAALAALRQESISREFERIEQDVDEDGPPAKIYQPLAKVLNMKF